MSRSETFKPLYKKLVEKIELDIIRRNLKTGDFFCILKDLCDQYKVSIITVRKAVSILENNGILSCKSASGIYIANRELLNTLNAFERIILIPHHHYKQQPNLFFELRLSSLLQTLAQKGYVGLPIYREDLNPERINLLGQRVLVVIGGNSMARELLPRNAASPKLMLINPPQEIAPSPQVCLCRYDFREQFRKSYEFAMRRNMPEIVRLVTDPSYHVPDLEAQASLVQFDLPKLDQTEPAIETGRRMANELFAKGSTSDCFFWITDDFVALGVHEVFLERGINLIAEQRILVNASPSFPLIEAMGLPVIGFGPTKIGHDAASFFCDFLDALPEARPSVPLLISPEANRPAQI